MNTKITLEEWLQCMVIDQDTKPPNSFTINEILEKTQINRKTLVSRLDKLIQEGKLKRGACTIGGRIMNYYIPTELENVQIHNNKNERSKNESKRINGRTATKIHSRVRKEIKDRIGGIAKTKR